MKRKTKQSSTTLSYLLRHDDKHTLEPGGWRTVEELVSNHAFTREQIAMIVANDAKGRYELNADKTKVRALYGHSVPVDMGYTPCTPPDVLYHGTSHKAVTSIMEQGIDARSRNYVHLTDDYDTALATGARHGAPLVLVIDARAMHEAGYEFYNPKGGMWLVHEVPRRYLQLHRGSNA